MHKISVASTGPFMVVFFSVFLLIVPWHVQSQENTTKPTDIDLVQFSQLKQKPWYDKVNFFAENGKEYRNIKVSREPENKALISDYFKGDYDSTSLSLTAGGNLFSQTSVYLDFTLNRFTLKGYIKGQGQGSYQPPPEPVKYQRNTLLTELFFERQFSKGFTAGFDFYYSNDPYVNLGEKGSFIDEGYGGGLLLSRQFKLKSSSYRLDYIFSHRRLNPGAKQQETISSTFHSALLTYSYQWSYSFSTDINARVSYYPKYDSFSYWDTQSIYSLGAEFTYRLWGSNEIVLKTERMDLGDGDSINTLALTFEHHFSAQKSKRRKRRHKIPQLLIK